jgi:hypothetical protein
MEVIEQAYILWVLQAEGGNKTRAAEVLGIDPSTLYRKLNRYGIEEFSESKNVVVTVGAADTDGWGADASHSGTTVACGLFYGTSSSTNGTVAGVVRCSNETS